MRGSFQASTADIIPAQVLSDIFNRFNFEYSAFSGLKVDSRRRKKKSKKSKKRGKKEEKLLVGVEDFTRSRKRKINRSRRGPLVRTHSLCLLWRRYCRAANHYID